MDKFVLLLGPTTVFWCSFWWGTTFGKNTFDHINFEMAILFTLVICLGIAQRVDIIELRRSVDALKSGKTDEAEKAAAKTAGRMKWAEFAFLPLIVSIVLFSWIDSENRKSEHSAIAKQAAWFEAHRHEHGEWPEADLVRRKVNTYDYRREDGDFELTCSYGIWDRYRLHIYNRGDRVRIKRLD